MRFPFAALALLLPLAAAVSACDDPFGGREPVIFNDTLTLAAPSVDSAALGSALNLLTAGQVVFPERIIDAFPEPNYDVSIRLSGGTFSLVPIPSDQARVGARVVAGRTSDFAGARTAPDGRDSYGVTAVPLVQGQVYFARSRSYLDQVGVRCVNYAKLQPLELRPAAGTVRLAVTVNNNCNDRRLRD